MSIVSSLFGKGKKDAGPAKSDDAALADFMQGFSIEVMPRTAGKIEDFRAILPEGTRVYIAHIDGTPIEDMVSTAKRIAGEGFEVMPHFPARVIPSRAALEDWIKRYQDEAGITSGLLLGGGLDKPNGEFEDSMQLLETGLFGDFKKLHVAGHPEGNKDIDPDGGDKNVMEAIKWKQAFANNSDADFAMATQFIFESEPVVAWAKQLKEAGVTMPIHIGVAGPAKLQTMIKFAMECGVGPSLRVLQRRAADVSKLLLPFTPEDLLRELAAAKAADPELNITQVHFFPLGGIKKTSEFTQEFGNVTPMAATA